MPVVKTSDAKEEVLVKSGSSIDAGTRVSNIEEVHSRGKQVVNTPVNILRPTSEGFVKEKAQCAPDIKGGPGTSGIVDSNQKYNEQF